MAVDDDSEGGERVGRYELRARLGAGGLGVVYRAFDPDHQREIALKVVVSPAGIARTLRELQAIARVAHPNVIPIYDTGIADDRVFVAMELVRGATLRAWLADRERGWADVVDAFGQAARGLAAAHGHGVVHRGFTPDNVLIGRDGRARVVDFGLAGPSTRRYWAPEQFRGEPPGEPGDQFSLCAAMFEAIYGKPPFGAGDDDELERRVVRGELVAVDYDRAPARVYELIRRGLRVDPGERFPSMDALVDELHRARPPRRERRRPYNLAAIAAAAFAVALVLVATIGGGGDEPSASRAAAPVPPGAEREQLTSTGSARAPALSADGNWLAYVQDGVVRARFVGSGEERELSRARGARPVAWSPRARLLAIATGGGYGEARVEVWDVSYGTQVGSLAVAGPLCVPDDEPIVAAVEPGGAAVEPGGAAVAHRRVSDGATVRRFELPAELGAARAIACARGRYVGIGRTERGDVVWTAAEDGAAAQVVVPAADAPLGAISLGPRADTLYYTRGRDLMRLDLDPATGAARGEPRVIAPALDGADVTVGGLVPRAVLAAGAQRSRVELFERVDAASPARATELTAGTGARRALALSADGARYAVAEPGASSYAIEARALPRASGPGWKRSHPSAPLAAAWSPDGAALAYTTADERGARLWITRGGKAPAELELSDLGGTHQLAWLPSDELLFTTRGDPACAIVPVAGGAPRPCPLDVGQLRDPLADPTGARVAAWWSWHPAGLYVFDLAGDERRLLVPGRVAPAAWSADGRYLFAARLDAGDAVPILRVPLTGAPPEPWAVLAVDPAALRELRATPDGAAFLAITEQPESDLHMLSWKLPP